MFTDEHDIERELTAALGVQPSSGFEARVLRAAADGRSVRRAPWLWLGAAAAVMLIAGIWAVSGGTRQPQPERVETRADPRAVVEPARPEAGSPGSIRAMGHLRAPKPPQMKPTGVVEGNYRPSEPEVLVPANQLALITAFSQEIQGGRIQLPEDADPEARLETLVVPKVTIQPIAVAALEPAASGPGSKGLQP